VEAEFDWTIYPFDMADVGLIFQISTAQTSVRVKLSQTPLFSKPADILAAVRSCLRSGFGGFGLRLYIMARTTTYVSEIVPGKIELHDNNDRSTAKLPKKGLITYTSVLERVSKQLSGTRTLFRRE
jgi:hypothetical protein